MDVIQTSKIMTKSIRIIWQKVDASLTFCKIWEKLLHFHLLSALKLQVFSVMVFKLLPSLTYFHLPIFVEYFKLINYPVNENFILRKIS